MTGPDELHEVDLLGLDSDPLPPPLGANRRWPVVAVLATAAAVFVVGLVVSSSDGDSPGGELEAASVDDDAITTGTTTSQDPGPGEPVNSYGPYGWPVSVEPADGLVDGQTVRLTATQFPVNTTFGVVMCSSELLDHHGQGPTYCDQRIHTTIPSGSRGEFSVEVALPRMILLQDGTVVDCADPPPPGRTATCVVALGSAWESGLGGMADVHFDPSLPPPAVPIVTVEPLSGLADGQSVTIRVTGLADQQAMGVSQCTTVAGEGIRCEWTGATVEWELVQTAEGPVHELELVVYRRTRAETLYLEPTDAALVDCTDDEVTCQVQVWIDSWPGWVFPLEFDPATPFARWVERLAVEDPDWVMAGNHIGVLVGERDPSQAGLVSQCVAGTELCHAIDGPMDWTPTGAGPMHWITVVGRIEHGDGASTDCTAAPGTCVIRIAAQGSFPRVDLPLDITSRPDWP